jgi:outer membrane protein OmpA-like peptidoglycan-associated protein
MRRITLWLGIALLSVAFGASWTPAEAQFGGLKDKLKQKVEKKVEKTVDGKDSPEAENAPEAGDAEEQATPAAAGAQGGTATAADMTLYTKYDFVPGDKVIFYDDLSGEEAGEFPSRWRLDSGVFEIARQGGQNWILCTDKGYIRPKIAVGPLPPKYTIEFTFYAKGPEFRGHWFHIQWLNADDEEIGNFQMTDNEHTHLRLLNKDLADKDLPTPLAAGLHAMRVMATKSSVKCYIDNERVANVPAVEGFQPVDFRVNMDPYMDEPGNPMLMGDFRYAEGGKTLREQLDEAGRIVTHGILFDSGSARIRAESYKTLADIGSLLTEAPALRLSIEGHTDSDGSDESNLKLSQDRAGSVKTYLVETYKIDAARLESKGWGEGKPIDANTTAEGKANNRRVELVKL